MGRLDYHGWKPCGHTNFSLRVCFVGSGMLMHAAEEVIMKLFEVMVSIAMKAAAKAANVPSWKGMYQEDMPESVRKLKQQPKSIH